MTSRTYAAPVAEPTPAERTSESRRRADRARPPAVQPAPSETERDEAASPAAGPERTNFSAGSIPTTPASQDGTGGEGALLAEGASPPPAPEPGITAEQVAAREEQLAAAQTALDSAEESPGLMDALAAAPPTLKAQVSGDLGQRFSEAMGSETEQIQQDTPEITAEMNGNTPPPAGQITDPAVTTVELEPTPPTPTPDAEAIIGSGTTVDENYSANDSVTAQFRRNFDAEGGADDVNRALDNVQTRDPSIPSSPGTPPIIPQSGETDPQRFGNQIAEGSLQARNTLAAQQEQARALPGADRVQLADVHESVPVGDLTPPTAESGAAPEGAQQYLQMDQPPEVQTAFDQIAGEGMQQSLAEAQTQVQQAAQDRDTQHQEAVATAQSDTAEAQQQAESDQRDQVREARNGIEGQRRSTLEQQQNAVADVEQQAEDRRSTDRDQFDDRVRTDQAQIDGRYSQAETDANNEITAGERQAEEERRRKEREAEDQSWWEAALDFITDLFDALVSLINDIFDAVRAAVNAILDAVRDFAIGLIDALANALKSLIHAFGDFLKGLVQGLLGDLFPELAAALTAFIDEAVALADRAIDAVAETLKSAVNAIVEALRAGLMALINIYQAAVNAALSLARAALTGDWSAFLIQLLEAACRVAGIDPNTIYEFIGRAQETIDIIVNDPGQFVSNVLDAVLGGFRLFADNFLTHLQTSVIEWLTGALGGAGITLPERFDLMGVISLVAQILGLTWENLRLRLVRIVGERGVQVIEFVASYIQTLIEGGWSALWERIQNDLATLRDMVLEQLRNFIVERIIMAAVTRLATMFNPVGALVNLLIAAYNFYTFVRDQMQRIVQVVTTVGGMIIDIAHGNLGPAQQAVEGVLARLLTLALDLLARLLSLGNVGERVRGILQRVQDAIWRAIDRLINSVIGLFRGSGEGGMPVAAADAEAGAPGAAGEIHVGTDVTITVPDEESHHLYFEVHGQDAVLMVRSDPRPVADLLNNWERSLNTLEVARQGEATRLITQVRGLLQETNREADIVAVSRYRALQATPERRQDEAAIASREQTLSQQEQQMAGHMRQLFPMFVDDIREVASRFERALSMPAFEIPFTWQTWSTAFQIRERQSQDNIRWGRENDKIESVPGRGQYLLKLSDDDLVPLASRVISAHGRLSETLGNGRPFFMSQDVRQFCITADRLPNDPGRFPDPIIQRIVQLLQQRAEISEDTQTRGQFIFAEIPSRRGIPANWDSDKYRRHFYLNRSNFNSEKQTIINNEFPRIVQAVDNMLNADQSLQQAGQRFWAQLIRTEAIYSDRPFNSYNPNQLKNRSEWDVDHIRPLALHWETGAGAGAPGHNTDEEHRHTIAGGSTNLRIMWGSKNSEERARGGHYIEYVGRDFTSLVTRTKGPAYVDYDEKFTEYRPR
ncbi:MAG: hypothetical protein KDI79_23785 [Anaerolineae bacterium]|nr:hypothetical protein [Anaerolineae bacterium]